MSREIITISKMGAVTVPTAPVWMTQFEIADLFGVFSCNIRKMIQAIYKNKELNETDTMKYIKQTDGISYDVYNFEMIIAIAFKICSKETLLLMIRRPPRKESRLHCLFPMVRMATYGIVEVLPVSHLFPMHGCKGSVWL